MTIFNQFRRENSNTFLIFLPLKIVNFDSKIKIDHFLAFQEFVIFGPKNGPLKHCVISHSCHFFFTLKSILPFPSLSKMRKIWSTKTVAFFTGRIIEYISKILSLPKFPSGQSTWKITKKKLEFLSRVNSSIPWEFWLFWLLWLI